MGFETPAPEADPATGLEPADAAARLASMGPNELPPPPVVPFILRLARQVAEPMALLLIVAAAVAGIGLRDRLDGIAILAIVVLNAAIGLLEEGKATRAIDALRTMESPVARVRRRGRITPIPARDIVVGDVVILSAGDRVPADLRLVEASALEVDESTLTGESLPVVKDPEAPEAPMDLSSAIADRPWAAFAGTLVTRGTGTGIAIATGPQTALGSIARHLSGPVPPTPLQRDLRVLTVRLGSIAVLIAVGVFGLVLVRMGLSSAAVERAFLASVALAVAAVPEGLATVVTLGLAMGVKRLAARGAIVRRLPAVETLGATTVIVTDKTGTLTQNRLELSVLALAGAPPVPFEDLPAVPAALLAEALALCNDATLDPPSGDPVDLALLDALGPERVNAAREARPRLAAMPFDSARRRMDTLYASGAGVLALVKGAPEAVIEICTEAVTPAGGSVALDEASRTELLAMTKDLAGRGMRMLAIARRELESAPADLGEARSFTFLALLGLRDPVRLTAASVVGEARSAGIELVMVTGDHAGTAVAIAEEVGLRDGDATAITGEELRSAGIPSDPVLAAGVYARVDPDQKLDLVRAIQQNGNVVAVTGDGVNDAPALRQADIGVAMGLTGSDVARESSDMVVTDDDLATIVAAVREGRGIYDNIRKVVDYLVAGNLSEIGVVVASLLLFPALGVPLLPLQLLWINLLTDGFPALALGLDPVAPGVMNRPPRAAGARILTGRRVGVLGARAAWITAAAVGSVAVVRGAGGSWEEARTTMFTVLVVAHLLYAFVVRLLGLGPDARIRLGGLLANRWLVAGVGFGLALQIATVLWPPARTLFQTVPLAASTWALVAALGFGSVVAIAAVARRSLRRDAAVATIRRTARNPVG